VVRRAVDERQHPDLIKGVSYASLELVATQAQVGRTERDVLTHRRHEQLVVGVLENDPDPAADLGQVLGRDGQASHGHRAMARGEDAVEMQYERRLARAVGPEHRHSLAPRDGQVDAEERRLTIGVGEGQRPHVQRRDADLRRAGHVRRRAVRATARASAGSTAAVSHCERSARASRMTGIVPV
jgi:hypothetical protein